MEYLVTGCSVLVLFMISWLSFLYKRHEFLKRERQLKEIELEKSPYRGLRDLALKNKPSDLGLHISEDNTEIYGVVMDLGTANWFATVVAYQTGDASLYLSNGGGIIGGVKHESVSDSAKQFIKCAQSFLANATKEENTSLPQKDQANFYLLTNNEIWFLHEKIKNFENNSSPFMSLFTQGNELLFKLRTNIEH